MVVKFAGIHNFVQNYLLSELPSKRPKNFRLDSLLMMLLLEAFDINPRLKLCHATTPALCSILF